MSKSIVSLVHDVAFSAHETGLDVSPKDCAFIISQFLIGMAGADGSPEVNDVLLDIADAVLSTRDE